MRACEVPVQLQKEIWYPLNAKQCGGTQMWATLYFLPDSVLNIHKMTVSSTEGDVLFCAFCI